MLASWRSTRRRAATDVGDVSWTMARSLLKGSARDLVTRGGKDEVGGCTRSVQAVGGDDRIDGRHDGGRFAGRHRMVQDFGVELGNQGGRIAGVGLVRRKVDLGARGSGYI